jgi:hypothetical protein
VERVNRTTDSRERDCPPIGVSGLTCRQLSAGRLVTVDQDDHGHERDAQGCEEEDVVVDGVGKERAAIAELAKAARERGDDITGPEGLLKSITATVLEAALEEEMTDHLGARQPPGPRGWCGQHPQRHAGQDCADRRRRGSSGRGPASAAL